MDVMPGTSNYTETTPHVPLPVLGLSYNQGLPKTWKNAPGAVRSAFALSLLGSLFAGGCCVLCFNTLSTDHFDLRTLGMGTAAGIVAIADIYLGIGHRKRIRKAWGLQCPISIISVLLAAISISSAVPLGTILHLLILKDWFKPETKAWYGIE